MVPPCPVRGTGPCNLFRWPRAQPGGGTGTVPGSELLHRVRDLQRQNVDLAGQVGYLQRVVQERDEQLQLLLAAPNEGDSETPSLDSEISTDRYMQMATPLPFGRALRLSSYGLLTAFLDEVHAWVGVDDSTVSTASQQSSARHIMALPHFW